MKRSFLVYIFCLFNTVAFSQQTNISEPIKEGRKNQKNVNAAHNREMHKQDIENTGYAQGNLTTKSLNRQSSCLTVYVIDTDNNTLLKGAKFSVRNSVNQLVGEYVATNGLINIPNLKYDTYIVTCTTLPAGYETDIREQSIKLGNSMCKELTFKYNKPKSIVFKWDNDFRMKTVRIGEYYWMDNNFNWTETDPWNTFLFPSMSQAYLDTYMKCILIDKSKYQVNMSNFNKYYGIYVNHDGMLEVSKYGRISENGKIVSDWKLPSYADVRQLFAMCPFNTVADPVHDILNERDVRFALSPKPNQNPMAFNFSSDQQSWYQVYWFSNYNTNKYGFNLMPAGFRFVANNIAWSNGLGNWIANSGDMALLFYTAYFPVTDDDATPPYKMNGLALLHDSIDYVPFSWEVDNRYPFRWCRKLTDSELGYKLYIKANSDNWSSIASQLATKGEEPILRELINNRILPKDIRIVKKNLNEGTPSGYTELPKGYIRGFYVQYLIDNPNIGKTVEDIVNYAIKVQDNYVRNLKDKQPAKQLLETVYDIILYPNPVENFLQIKSSNNENIKSIDAIKIYDVNGNGFININNPQTNSVDLSNLRKGLYVAKIWINGKVYTHRIVKK